MYRATWIGLLLLTSCAVKEVTVFQVGAHGGEGGVAGGGQAGQGGSAGTVADLAGSAGTTPDQAGSAGVAPDVGGAGGSVAGGGGGGSGGDVGMVCSSNDDCPQGWFCERTSCDAPTGSCDLRPTKFTFDYAPVCGCDGVTYWNDVTRRIAGRPLLVAEQCSTSARPCNFGGDCGDFASCARLVSRGEQCAPSSEGACWLLPPDCPDPAGDPDVWQECRPPIQGVPPPPCIDTCRAIRSEFPHQRPRDVNMCP